MNWGLAKSLSLMAWRNLRRNRRRNAATGIAITAGFTAFLLAAGFANRVDNVLSRYTIYGVRAGHITILHKDALEMFPIRPRLWSLTPEHQQKIQTVLEETPGIDIFGPLLTGQGIIGNGCKTLPFLANGVDLKTEQYAMTNPELRRWAPHIGRQQVGKPLWEHEPSASVVAISSGLAKLLGKRKVLSEFSGKIPYNVLNCSDENINERFSDDPNVQLASGTWDGQLNALDADIVQTYSTGMVETNNSSIIIGIKQLQSLLHTDNVKSYSIWLKDPLATRSMIETLKARLANSGVELDILPWNDERIGPYYVGTMRFISTMVTFIGFVLALVIILSIFNSATMTVIERSEEVGMLRSLGYTKRLIRIIFALEGFYLALVGTVTGIVCGVVSMLVINSAKLQFNPPGVVGGVDLEIVADFRMIVLATFCVSSLGLIATWAAVTGISRKNISELIAGAHR